MGSMMGKTDPNATNSMLDGKVVATGTPGAQVAADPNKGLSGGQMFARQGISSGLAGLGQGLQAMGNAPQPGGPQIAPPPGATPVDPSYFMPQKNKMGSNPFYGGA